MRFTYRAKTSPTEIIDGIIEADNKQLAQGILIKQGVFPIYLEEEAQKNSGFKIFNRISDRDINIFTQQLSNLISAGLPLLKALEVICEQTQNQKFKVILSEVKDKVKKGTSLSVALLDHKKIFKPYYAALIRAGESAGALDSVCVSLSEYAEKKDELRLKIQAAISYPVLIFIVGVVTLYILFAFVIPKLSFLFLSLSDSLPFATRALIAFSEFLKTKSLIILVCLAGSFYAFKKYISTVNGQFKFDKFILTIPLLGQFIKKSDIAIFIKTLALLTKHGLSISEALEIASGGIKNRLLYEKINELRVDVVSGLSLKEALLKKDYFEPFAISLISTAQESGSFNFAFSKVSEIYERDIEMTVKTFTSILEPIMILFMGIIVGLIVIAMLLPIFQVNLLIR